MSTRQREGTSRPPGVSATANVLFLICLMYGITYIDRVNYSTAATVFHDDLHLTRTQVGLAFSAFGYPYLIFQVFGGWVSDRFGARLTLTVCGVIWASATMLTGLAGSLATLFLARIVLGFGEGATFPTATRAMSDWTPPEKRGFAQGITHACARLGNALTPLLVAWLIVLASWRGSFVILGIVSLFWVVAWGWYFRDNPGDHPKIAPWELLMLPKYTSRAERIKEPAPWLPLARRMLPVTLVYFCYGWTLWLYLSWIPSFFSESYQLSLTNAAVLSSGVYFLGAVGNTVGGIASDRIFRQTGSRNKARRNLVVFGFLASLVSIAPILFVHNVTWAVVFLSISFFFAEFTIGPMWAIPMDIAPRFSGTASGLMNTGSALAAIISPVVFGYVVDKTGTWELPFIGSMGLLLLGAILAFWMKPDEGLGGASLNGNKAAIKVATA
jgi:MFS family permease